MKLAAIATLFLGLVGACAMAAEQAMVTPVFATKKSAQEALKGAKELLVGSVVKDTAGCLYAVGADSSKLVLIPVVINGSKVCSTKG